MHNGHLLTGNIDQLFVFRFQWARVDEAILGKLGIFDVDDIILNVIGGFIGFIVYKALLVVLKKHEKEYLI